MELYIVNRIKKTTIRNYIDSYNRCIKYIGYMKLADIQITHVQNMVIELANKGYKKSAIRSTVSVVSSCLERANRKNAFIQSMQRDCLSGNNE